MIFNSLEFIIFYLIALFLFTAFNTKYKWLILLLLSYYFYMYWEYRLGVILFFSTLSSYFCGLKISESQDPTLRKTYLVSNIVFNMGIFAYFNYFYQSVNFTPPINKLENLVKISNYYRILLPIGISFYTLQAISYTLEIFQNQTKAEKHFGKFALFISFFPKLLIGPIESASKFLPQLKQQYYFNYDNIKTGMSLIIWGFFKKIIIADRVSEYVNIIFKYPYETSGTQIIFATFFFSFQIYCELSAYADIATGIAKTLNINLSPNFKRPYLALSITNFWERWFITLTYWTRELTNLLFNLIPFLRNVEESHNIKEHTSIVPVETDTHKWKNIIKIPFFFLIIGMWYGAKQTFLLWALFHSLFFLTEHLVNKKIKNFNLFKKNPLLHQSISFIYTFTTLCFLWIIFRSNNIQEAFTLINRMFYFYGFEANLFFFKIDFYISIASIVFLILIEFAIEKYNLIKYISQLNKTIKWIMLFVFIFTILILGKWTKGYFNFFVFS